MKFFAIVFCVILGVHANAWKHAQPRFFRKAAVTGLIAVSMFGSPLTPNAAVADGAFSNSLAMMKDKGPEVKARFENVKSKEFADLGEAGKKRMGLKGELY